jgi:putative transposase
MPTELVLTALELTQRQLVIGQIIHADRGRQYTSPVGRTHIERAQALASYSRPGSPYNAQAEAGCSTLKTELLPHGGTYANLEEARLEAAYYQEAG